MNFPSVDTALGASNIHTTLPHDGAVFHIKCWSLFLRLLLFSCAEYLGQAWQPYPRYTLCIPKLLCTPLDFIQSQIPFPFWTYVVSREKYIMCSVFSCSSLKFTFFLNRGIVTGIYTTNTPEACYYIAYDCKANIIVVENQKQLDKIMQVWGGCFCNFWVVIPLLLMLSKAKYKIF